MNRPQPTFMNLEQEVQAFLHRHKIADRPKSILQDCHTVAETEELNEIYERWKARYASMNI